MHKFHYFNRPISPDEWPARFTFPFHYKPHPLAIEAASHLQAYLTMHDELKDEWKCGKMFGVLVVTSPKGETGFLAAFSGVLAGQAEHSFFVPPIYNHLSLDGFFRQEEEEISAINAQVEQLEKGEALREAQDRLTSETNRSRQLLEEAKLQQKASKARRDELRFQTSDPDLLAKLIRESQYEKAEIRRLHKSWEARLAQCRETLDRLRDSIDTLKHERSERSLNLQKWLFEQYRIYNAHGESIDLTTLFANETGALPPAGAGDCAAPKLLQYAYTNGYHPLALAEFWWGESSRTEMRRHGYYYPACRNKCGPILGFMLQGLQVDDNPLEADTCRSIQLPVLYEDAWMMVVDKPVGLLSVPGNKELDSVYERVHGLLPNTQPCYMVHRLDMATSGLLVIAKTDKAYKQLQAQFADRLVRKRYVALLDGLFKGEPEGTISLPLCADYQERPRQKVDEEMGKPTITHYQIVGHENGLTRVIFYPVTGRTHQLRVHAAHPNGLNLPIRGDELYGRPADRLYLHAEAITFTHPGTGASVSFERKAPF